MLFDLRPLAVAVGPSLERESGHPTPPPPPLAPKLLAYGRERPSSTPGSIGLILGSSTPVLFFSTSHFFGSLFLFFIPQWIDWWVSRIPEKGVSHHLFDCFSTQEHENLTSH